MGLESATYIDDLVTTNPVGASDPKSQGDDHLRLIKSVLKATFPGLVGRFQRVQTKSGTYQLVATDTNTVFALTGAPWTLSAVAAATLGNGFQAVVYNAGSSDITLDPNGAETVNGAATLLLAAKSITVLICDGTQFYAFSLVPIGTQGDLLYADAGGVWRRLAAGTAGQFLKTLGAGANPAWANAVSFAGGQCQLQYVNSTTIKLVPMGGNLLTVHGVPCTVPDAGVTLSNAGLTAAAKYYIYATQSGGAINALAASATAYAVDTTAGNNGVYVENANSDRSLVGMIYTGAGTPGVFVPTQVRSWFHDPGITNSASPSAGSSSSASYVKADSASDLTLLVWANELVKCWATGSVKNTGASNYGYVSLGIDGVSAEDSQVMELWSDAGTVDQRIGFGITAPARALSEGAHTLSLLIANAGGGTTSLITGGGAPTSTPSNRTTFGFQTAGNR